MRIDELFKREQFTLKSELSSVIFVIYNDFVKVVYEPIGISTTKSQEEAKIEAEYFITDGFSLDE